VAGQGEQVVTGAMRRFAGRRQRVVHGFYEGTESARRQARQAVGYREAQLPGPSS